MISFIFTMMVLQFISLFVEINKLAKAEQFPIPRKPETAETVGIGICLNALFFCWGLYALIQAWSR